MASEKRVKNKTDDIESVLSDWQITFDAIVDPVMILDKDLNVKKANKAATQLLKGQRERIEGEKCFSLFSGADEPCMFCPIPLVKQEKGTFSQEIKSKYLGNIFFVSWTPIMVKGDVVGYIHSAKDISLQRELEKQLIQAHKMDAIATLAGGIAHDFNNILGVILGNADLLLYRLPQDNSEKIEKTELSISHEDIVDHIQSIKRAGVRAKDLVTQILAFSRQSKSKRKIILLTPLIKESCKFLRSSYPATIDLKISVEQVGRVFVDPSQIQQVLMNLCNNAVQALENKIGIVEVSLREVEIGPGEKKRYPDLAQGKYIALAVRDNGRGISEEVLQRIFDPFFTTRDVGDGSGMGLAVLHGVILAHNGVIDVKSAQEKGTVFTVFLPRVEEDSSDGNGVVTSMPRGNETILFVDDEEEIVSMRMRMLEYLGYKVLPASNPEKALDYFKEGVEKIDLLITDHTMPRMTGLQLAHEALKYNENLPVILCSGYSDAVTSEEARRVGIKRFLAKPLDTRLLAVAIREILPEK